MEHKSPISSSSGHSNHPNKQPTKNNTLYNSSILETSNIS